MIAELWVRGPRFRLFPGRFLAMQKLFRLVTVLVAGVGLAVAAGCGGKASVGASSRFERIEISGDPVENGLFDASVEYKVVLDFHSGEIELEISVLGRELGLCFREGVGPRLPGLLGPL